MFRLKKLYFFVLGTYLPLLLATFSICLFVFLMQFLWKYVDDLVGKGADMKILAQFFFYAALFLVPMALPIAILLASLMAFGNLGEHLELLAMKSSGISLLRIMKPLIIFSIFVSGIAFVFQNNVLPKASAKLWTIVASLRMKSPELDIPEGEFYKEIPGYNIYVGHKTKTGLLKYMMIYDYSKGFDNAMVIVSDSGRMKMSEDKKYLILSLFSGASFQNMGTGKSLYNQKQIPFQRQTFTKRDILIAFDSNFNMVDKSLTQNRDFSKNIPALRSFIRTASAEDDSIARTIRPNLVAQVYTAAFKQEQSYPVNRRPAPRDTLLSTNFQTLFDSLPAIQRIQLLENAKSKIDHLNSDFNFQMFPQSDRQKDIRGHQIELHKKFTYSLACLLFFFIGAPLGAIIRKGGLGLPAILSIVLFLVYYTVDIFGWKMAKQDSWAVWQGMWLSSLVLASLGAFFTYKAVNDSVMINPDAWKETLQRLIGKREMRNYAQKEVIMTNPDYPEDIRLMTNWNEDANRYLAKKGKIPFYITFWKQHFHDEELNRLLDSMNRWIEDMLNSNENLIIGKLMDYPVINPYRLEFLNRPAVRLSCSIFLPVGIIIYILYFVKQKQIDNDLRTTKKVNEEISKELRNLNLVCEQQP